MKRILLVEGQKEMGDFLSKFFLLKGYEVESVEDGEAALNLAKKKHYDLVVADFPIPPRNGLDLTKKLKLHNPDLSILVISESGVGEAFFREAGADAFLTKPLDLSSMEILAERFLAPRNDPL